MRQLDEKVSSIEEIDHLDVANLVYGLLLDREKALADLANKNELVFSLTLSDPEQPYSGIFNSAHASFSLDGFYPPDRICETTIVTTDRETFFATPLEKNDERRFTVAELIKHPTEVAGARHAGGVRGEVQETLDTIEIALGGKPILTRQVIAIGKVVRDALLPLATDVADSDP